MVQSVQHFEVCKEVEFDAAHRVPNHKSKCRNLHGHRYRVIVHVTGPLSEDGSDEGMVLDFGDIKRALMEKIHDVYDHSLILYDGDPVFADMKFVADTNNWILNEVNYVPTAENMAAAFYYILREELSNPVVGVEVRCVEVYETPTSVAVFPGGF